MFAHNLIQALGGTSAVAKLLGIGASAVSNWKAAGRIPDRWYRAIARECARRGIACDERAFGAPEAA